MNLNRRQMIGSAAAGCCSFPALAGESTPGTLLADQQSNALTHLVLLGDSVFANQRYVAAGQSIAEQVQSKVAGAARVSLLAVDGDTTKDIAGQLRRLPTDATHLVLSVGGNDALANSSILNQPATTASDLFLQLAEIRESFERDYRRMLDQIASAQLPVVLSTIYDPRFEDVRKQKMSVAALGVFNDVITRSAATRGWPLLDLRVIFSQAEDYANAIEPSSIGGEKLARAIVAAALSHAHDRTVSGVYV